MDEVSANQYVACGLAGRPAKPQAAYRDPFLVPHLRQGQVQACEMVPGVVFGKLADRAAEATASFFGLTQEQSSQAAVEQHWGALRQPLPNRCGLLPLAPL